MLHKLRRAMVRPDREPLHIEVEVDEAYLGGPEAGLRGGRALEDTALVVAAVEVRGKGSGRVQLQVVPDASARSLTGFVTVNVAQGTVVRTDGWQGYAPLASMGSRHQAQVRLRWMDYYESHGVFSPCHARSRRGRTHARGASTKRPGPSVRRRPPSLVVTLPLDGLFIRAVPW